MNCTHCHLHACRTLGDCTSRRFDLESTQVQYQTPEIQVQVQAAARLVDDGRAGSLTRLQEIVAFAQDLGYKHLGLAYCYGRESLAKEIGDEIRQSGLRVSTVSCTTGGLAQNAMNSASCKSTVGCNPLGQAAQLNSEGVDMVVAIALCLGHDMLLQKALDAPCTTLVVKERKTA